LFSLLANPNVIPLRAASPEARHAWLKCSTGQVFWIEMTSCAMAIANYAQQRLLLLASVERETATCAEATT
jgi:hypothetical protein